MSKKLAAKASLIQALPEPTPKPSPVTSGARAEATEVRPKTAPGSMALFMASQSAAIKEAEELRERLKAFDGAKPVRALDAKLVRPSRWANRHEHSYSDAAFAELKADIAAAAGNVQPISVRPVGFEMLNGSTRPGTSPSGMTTAGEAAGGVEPIYEVVFGHRRHRACLELGLPVHAMIVELDDRAMFEVMDRENRARKSLSAWEQGMMYRRALDEGLYPSQRRLAESLGVDVSLVSKSLALARLPEAVVSVFATPLDIQFRWAQPLSEALQKDPEGMLLRASAIRQSGRSMTASEVFLALTSPTPTGAQRGSTPARRVIDGPAGRQAVIARDARGRLKVEFPAGTLTETAETELASFIETLLAKR